MKEVSNKVLSNDYLSSYAEVLKNSTSVSLKTKRLRTMVCEIFNTKQFKSSFYERQIFITHQILLIESIIHTFILKIQQSLALEFKGFWSKHMEHIA